MKVIAISEFRPQEDGGSVNQSLNVVEGGKVLDDLYQRKILKTIYLRKDRPGWVLLMECGTLEDAHQYLSKMPGISNGTTEYHLIPLGSELPPQSFLGVRIAGL